MKRFSIWLENRIEKELIAAGKEQLAEFPDPDYGSLYWNAEQKKVHWVAGDGAGGYTEAEKRFNKIKGVSKVEAADEYYPSKDEVGWKELRVRD